MIKYLFPYKNIDVNSNIILYGAGDVGQEFFFQIKETGFCNIMLWVDKNYEFYRGKGMPVNDPEEISSFEYDYIVVAIRDGKVANIVKEYLVGKGVLNNRIVTSIHFPRVMSIEKYFNKDIYIRDDRECKIEKMFPRNLITSDRLDIMVRYLLAKDIFNGIQNEQHLSLYSRFFLTVSGADEPLLSKTRQAEFSDYKEKRGIDNFLVRFKELVESMEKSGFMKDKSIPINKNGKLLNGSHRLSSALALEEEIWVTFRKEEREQDKWNLTRFEREGFSVEDKIRIVRAFVDLYKKCNLILLSGSVMSQWDFIESRIAKKYKIVGSIVLDFFEDYITYENLCNEIFDIYFERNTVVSYDSLMDMRFKLIVVSDEEGCKDIYDGLNRDIGTLINFLEVSNRECYVCKDKEDFGRLKDILLSVNNIKKERMKIRWNCNYKFLNRLLELKNYFKEVGISINDVCLTEDAVMEVFGLREAEKIDVIFKSKEDATVKLPAGVYGAGGYSDIFVDDYNLHFLFFGFKFVNPDILYKKKYARIQTVISQFESDSSKIEQYNMDKKDARLLELLMDYDKYFEDKKIVREKFDKEILRQWNKFDFAE